MHGRIYRRAPKNMITRIICLVHFIAVLCGSSIADDCLYSRISGGLLGSKTTYLFSCNSICTYWVFYVLDFPTPPSGAANRTIPFKADTVSLSTQNRFALDQLNAISQGSNVSITAWPGKLRLVAQCVYQMQNPLSSTYHDGVMLRDGDIVQQPTSTSIAMSLSPSHVMLVSSSSPVQTSSAFAPMPTSTPLPAAIAPKCNITQYISGDALIGYRYGCQAQNNATCTLFDGTVRTPCTYPIFIPTTNLSSGVYNISVTMTNFSDSLILSFMVPPALRVSFVKNSPIITGRTATVFVSTNKPVQSITCEVLSRNMFAVPPPQDCSNGVAIFSYMPIGESRIRVTAQVNAERSVVRSNLFLDGTNTSCSTYLINSLIELAGSQATVEFSSTGKPTAFTCLLDGTISIQRCESPLKLRNLSPGGHKLKITPKGCLSNIPQAFTFYV